jgi:hypothetical protein
MTEQITNNVIKAVIALAVIVVVLAIAFIFFKQFYPALKVDELKPEDRTKAEHEFDAYLVKNIESCKSKIDNDCICQMFETWPQAFPRNSVLTIKETSKAAYINLSYKGKILKNASIEGARFWAMKSDKEKISYSPEKSIDFSYEPPHYVQPGDINKQGIGSMAIISKYVYKTENGLYFIIGKEGEKADALEKTKQCT